MKVLVLSLLTLVGSCATISHKKKLQNIKNGIVFEDTELIYKYSESITPKELNDIVYAFSADEFNGRQSGEPGHNKACEFLRDYYVDEQIASPSGVDNYYQNVPFEYFPEGFKDSQNVMAFIEGQTYPHEIVIISGHSDHEGVKDDAVFYGADDNGSGTAALLEIAEAFNQARAEGNGPKRSLLFLHTTGEEIGLIGSKYYAEHPIFPLENTVVNLNVDMIGRVDEDHLENPNYFYLIGSDRVSTELHYISEIANNEITQLNLDYRYNGDNDPNQFFSRSDHYSFAQKGIPVIFYFGGIHEDYSKPTDTADKINYPLLCRRTRLVFATAWYLANDENRVQLDEDQ
ncbi:MAG: M28 family peptidase [Psychroserpens sp.]|nr:M28 family peptidase [Psychroserpens sp.]